MQSSEFFLNDNLYFRYFQLKVSAVDDGLEKMPKKKYAEKIKSHNKCVVVKKFKVDVANPLLFNEEATMWKSFLKELVEQNRSETTQHEEVHPENMKKINQLVVNVWEAYKTWGTDAYKKKLSIFSSC